MTLYYESSAGAIYHGDVLDVLKSMPDESVHMCVTSPPYWGLRDYGNEPQIWDCEPPEICEGGRDHVWGDELPSKGKSGWDTFERKYHSPGSHKTTIGSTMKKIEPAVNNTQGQFCQKCSAWRGSLGLEPTPELFIKHMVEIFSEVKRVLRDDGTLWLNMGDTYASQPASSGISFRRDRAAVVPRGRNLEGLKPKDLIGIPWRLALALQADGWYLRSDIIWHKPNPMPELVTDRPAKAHEYLFLLTKCAKYYYDAEAIKENFAHERMGNPRGGGNYAKQVTKTGFRNDGEYALGKGIWNQNGEHSGRNKRTVWTIPTQPMSEAHFATFPEKLIDPCIIAGTSEKGCCMECGAPWERVVEKNTPQNYEGKQGRWGTDTGRMQMAKKFNTESKTIGWQPTYKCPFGDMRVHKTTPCTVLDPFFGSGTTGIVAHKHGRKFVSIELSKKYLDDIAIPRIKKATKQKKLF